MLIEILANLGMSMMMFLRGTPSDEQINHNIKWLRREVWFEEIYSTNEELFEKDEDLRYIVGSAKVERVLAREGRTDRLREKIIEAVKASSYKYSS
ncbi:hypothetical protein EQV77_17890 [Halobacillus fulvus]|nr:hypothetical protein EQV77_17890 [Halobacillus fulvus]